MYNLVIEQFKRTGVKDTFTYGTLMKVKSFIHSMSKKLFVHLKTGCQLFLSVG